MRAGRDRQAQVHVLVGREGPGDGDLLVVGLLVDRRVDARTAHVELRDLLAVESQVQAVLFGDPVDGAAAIPLQPYPQLVGGVGRQVQVGVQPPAGAERQAVEMGALGQAGRRGIPGGDGRRGRVPDGEPGDLSRGRHVALEEQRRDAERVGDVVEPVRLVVRRQRVDVDVEPQQIADGVAILGAVHAVQQRTSGVGIGGGRAVQRGLQPGGEAFVGRVVGPRPAGWRHRAAAELPDDLLPDLDRVARLGQVDRLEHQPRGLQPRVVAGGAVALQHPRIVGVTLGSRLPGGGRGQQHRARQPDQGGHGDAPDAACARHRARLGSRVGSGLGLRLPGELAQHRGGAVAANPAGELVESLLGEPQGSPSRSVFRIRARSGVYEEPNEVVGRAVDGAVQRGLPPAVRGHSRPRRAPAPSEPPRARRSSAAPSTGRSHPRGRRRPTPASTPCCRPGSSPADRRRAPAGTA